MDFDNRQSDWKKYLELKSNIASAFKEESTCKICMCLELLKLVTCPSHCHSSEWEDLLHRFLDGVLDESSKETILSHVSEHFSHMEELSFMHTEVKELQHTLLSFNQELYSISDLEQQFEKVKRSVRSQPSAEQVSKINALENRISTFEENLKNMRREKEDLHLQLRRANLAYEEYLYISKNNEKLTQESLKMIQDEQHRLKATVEVIARQVSDSVNTIETMKKERTEIARTEMEAAIVHIRREKDEWVREQETNHRKMQSQIDIIERKNQEIDDKIDQAYSLLDKVRTESLSLQKRQEECREISRHSEHLLNASDSVVNAHKQFIEAQHVISDRLEDIKRELDAIKGHRAEEPEPKRHDELYHPGNLVLESGVFRWNCCRSVSDAEGCKVRFR